ncbi:MAG: hypothetical protein QF819_01165 [Gemmatimonadota bacterium]|jgi:hypothetical protein|nr:hypothetical protein [Gemmatimonadota bacterium]MDP6528167.1 hypothetical protein [Gemmatimonadota bacterium]MDP6801777.1 hypothetical protein [Gemmatimonadota bacterium]MDP7031147.1 hypothetical protein [Gemmatimonadota bacterium]
MERPAESFATAERLICMLRDVSSCEIQLGTDGAISAVHVTALPGRSPKQIARDVEAILAAEEGVHLDHRKISIAQYGEEDSASVEALGRVAVGGLSLHQVNGGYEAEVLLHADPIQATGRASGPNTRYQTRRIVALATLDAISRLVEGAPPFSLGEMEEKELGGRKLLVVCVNHAEGRSENSLFGCSEIGYDPTRAVIFAVLDAVNRLLERLPPREAVEYEIGPAPLA